MLLILALWASIAFTYRDVALRTPRFWVAVAASVVVAIAIPVLFAGSGSLTDPAGDGLITRSLRQATEDGPFIGYLGMFVVLGFWAAEIALFVVGVRMLQAARRPLQTVEPPNRGRRHGDA